VGRPFRADPNAGLKGPAHFVAEPGEAHAPRRVHCPARRSPGAHRIEPAAARRPRRVYLENDGGLEDSWLAIAVVKDGEVVFAHGYGVRESGKPAAVDTRTLFAIGSTTKAMTAALVGMLVDEKKVEWDRAGHHLPPWFQLKDPAVTREVTVRDLLTHRAGLGNADYLWYGQRASTDEILRRVRLIDPAYPVRSGFIYQNIMYAAAGALIEAVSGPRGPTRSARASSSRSACATPSPRLPPLARQPERGVAARDRRRPRAG
jgi:CubicO group peptidase (beta-lactamase class C family)